MASAQGAKHGAGGGGEDAASLIAAARAQAEKDPAGAVDALKRAVARQDCTPEQRLEAASIFLSAGDKAQAVAATLDAGSRLLYDVGDMAGARAAFAQAHQIDPSNLDVIFQMGQADVVEGRTQDALAKFIDVLRKSNLKHIPALFEAGCIYQSQGQYDQAILAFKKVLDRDKAHVQAIVHMGQLHQTKGMLPEALAYYLQAAEIARESAQLGTARQLCNMVLALDGGNQKARFMLDDLNERAQEQEEAQAAAAPPPGAPAPAAAPHPGAVAPSPSPPATPATAARLDDETRRSVDELAAQRGQLQHELEELSNARLDAEVALARAKDEAEAAAAARVAAITARAHAEAELATLTESVARTRAHVEDAVRRKADIDAQLTAATAAAHAAKRAESEAVASADKRRAEIESELAALAAKRAESQTELAALADAQAAATKRRSELEASLRALDEQRGGLETQSKALAAERTAAEAELRRLQDERKAVVSEAEQAQQRAAAASAEAAALKEQLQQLEARRADLGAAADAAGRSTEEAKASVADLRTQIETLEKRRAELTAATKAGEASSEQAQRAAKQAQDAAKKAETAFAELRSQVEALEKRRGELAAATQAGEASEKQTKSALAELRSEVEGLEKRRAELKTAGKADEAATKQAQAALADLRSQVEALEKRRAAAAAEAEAAVAARDGVRAEAAAAQAQLEALQAQIKTASAGAADAKKVQTAAAKLKELDAAVAAASGKLAEANASVEAADARKREIDEAYARSKSLAAAADERRAQATQAAEQAEALRSKREADAEAVAARIATLEAALKDADAKAKLVAGETAALTELSAKVHAQRKELEEAATRKTELDRQQSEAQQSLIALRREVEAAQAALQEAKASAEAAATAAAPGEPRRRVTDESYAEAVVAAVPPQSCAEALRTIESLAAEGEMPFEIAAELAGLIHEGRAVEALRVARARANLEPKPAPYLLAVGDLARDLGDAAGARDAYRTLAAADPAKTAVVHQRLGQLFLTFADQGTAAALARDDAHYAFAQEPAKALEAYAELVARFPSDPTFRQELGEVHERLGNGDAAALAYAQALTQYLAIDDAAKAVELVPRLLAVRPDNGAALELAARAYERAGKTQQACKALDEALGAYRHAKAASDLERVCRRLADIADDPVPYRRELAALLKDVGDIGGAAEQLLEAAETLLRWSNASDALTLLREAAALSSDAQPLADRIAAAKARAADAQTSIDAASRAGMFLSKKQYEKAAEAYRAAVDKNPYNADACYQLACLLTDQFPDLPTAEQLLENAAELRPDHTATRYRLALVKAARGDVEQAVELLVALARFDENNADFIDQFVERLEKDADSGAIAAKYRLGIAYRELGRVEEALVILQSIQREPEFIVLCLNAIGLCLRRQGLDTAAAKRFQKAIETAGYPENQYNEALYNLGDLYEAKRDPESLALSLSSFEELYARDCTYRDVADRIKSVKAKLGAAEGPKVKRLPNRSEAVNDR